MSSNALFKEFTLKNLVLKNRLAMAPMTRNFSPNGVPHKDAASYYARRAEGGIGLIITEGVEISHDSSSGYPNCPNLRSKEARSCLLYTSPSPRDATLSRMPSSA